MKLKYLKTFIFTKPYFNLNPVIVVGTHINYEETTRIITLTYKEMSLNKNET